MISGGVAAEQRAYPVDSADMAGLAMAV